MGFEFKVTVSLSKDNADDIADLFEMNKYFDKKVVKEYGTSFEFKRENNTSPIASFVVTLIPGGLYILRNDGGLPLKDIEPVKLYLEKRKIEFSVEEQ